MRLLHEGKAKQVYATEEPGVVLIRFKDDATAFDGKKRGSIEDKGRLNARMSAIFFEYLEGKGIPTHYLGTAGERELRARRVEIIRVEVVVRNVAAGSLAKRLGLAEGTVLARPVLELYLKDDELGDPLINRYHVRALGLAADAEMDRAEELALAVNDLLSAYLEPRGLKLIDFKLEFGRDDSGTVLLADEISPDTCRFWDRETGERLDKDRFRRDLGGVADAYREVLRRLERR
ncbi:MAG: phosphoribosylaminoimidazolesuccinocarboxamide synthase [bacterium]|nr:phosphoribosylaminoimidazolesuccinocarboxamide synthase [bacterium]